MAAKLAQRGCVLQEDDHALPPHGGVVLPGALTTPTPVRPSPLAHPALLDRTPARFAQAADPRSLVPEHRNDVSAAQRAEAGNVLAEVKRRVTLLKDHLQAEYRSTDDPFCIPCSNRASPRMLRRNETCEVLSLTALESSYCPGTLSHLQLIVKSKQHVKRSWFKQFKADGEGYCRARCQAAGVPYDDTNCCPVTMPEAEAEEASQEEEERLDARTETGEPSR